MPLVACCFLANRYKGEVVKYCVFILISVAFSQITIAIANSNFL